VTIYNRGQEYTRTSISPDGDRCDWFAVTPAVAAEIARTCDAPNEDEERPFTQEFALCSQSLYLQQRRLFLKVAHSAIDAFAIEEAVMQLVASVIARSRGNTPWPQATAEPTEAHRDLVERARAAIVANIAQHHSVAALALSLGTSPFHLCRVFRKVTGMTLHAYRLEVRQRMLLERLSTPNADLSRIAIELGFSSHSHLSATFRRRTGVTPRVLRELLARDQRF
jgi:AraC-like DNA-binding protein